MIIGLEGVHTCGDVTLNDRLADMPRFDLTGIPGLRSLPEFEPLASPSLGRTGEVPRRGDRGGKTFTFEGIVKCNNIVDLREAQALLGAEFMTTGELLWTMEPHADDPNIADLAERWYYARIVDVAPLEEWGESNQTRTGGFESVFSIVVRMSDPRFYFPDAQTAQSSTRVAGNDGAGDFTEEDEPDATPFHIDVTVQNDGNVETPGIITIDADTGTQITNPIVSNETTGKFLRFLNLQLDTNEGIVIDMKRRNIERLNGDNSRHKLDGLSTWWDAGQPSFVPGPNTIRLRGLNMAVDSILKVDWYSADIA